MQVSVNKLTGTALSFDDLHSNDAIEVLKNRVEEVAGLAPQSWGWSFAGRLLEDDKTFVDCNMGSGATVYLAQGVKVQQEAAV